MPSVKHKFWVEGNPPVLTMANDDDGFYVQTFKNHEEVEAFIIKMRTAAEKAFGSNNSGVKSKGW